MIHPSNAFLLTHRFQLALDKRSDCTLTPVENDENTYVWRGNCNMFSPTLTIFPMILRLMITVTQHIRYLKQRLTEKILTISLSAENVDGVRNKYKF